MKSIQCAGGYHFLCSDKTCTCNCHKSVVENGSFQGRPFWMSDQEWSTWLEEFSLDFEPVFEIPISRVTKEQATELRVMVYGN